MLLDSEPSGRLNIGERGRGERKQAIARGTAGDHMAQAGHCACSPSKVSTKLFVISCGHAISCDFGVGTLMDTQQLLPKSTGGTFPDRIHLLIRRVGSVSEIARMCGFSEGVVRSWRDGNTDPSRARCVTLAHTLGISLEWVVAGEGAIEIDPTKNLRDEQDSREVVDSQRPPSKLDPLTVQSPPAGHLNKLDTQRLNAALQLLQSELDLADSQLTMTESTDLLSELYEILGPGGANVNASAMMAFNRHLILRTR